MNKTDKKINRLPGMPVSRELNERCAGTSLFGSHAAQVFHEINNIKSK